MPHTQPGSAGAVSPSPSPMDGMDGARRMLPAAHALAVPIDGIDGADRSVRAVPAAGAAALGRRRLLARLLAQARVAAEKHPAAGTGSTLRSAQEGQISWMAQLHRGGAGPRAGSHLPWVDAPNAMCKGSRYMFT